MKVVCILGLALLSAGCGPVAIPSETRTEQPKAPVRSREMPPLTGVVNPAGSPHVERWAPSARLVNQSTSGSERPCHRESDDGRALRVNFDATGTRLVEWRPDAISVWGRESSGTRWMQVLREPWQASGVGWKEGRLALCARGPREGGSTSVARGAKGSLEVSLARGPTEWVEVPGATCMRDAITSSQTSSDDRWRTVESVTNLPNCKPTMSHPDRCEARTWEHIITISGSPPSRMRGGGVTPAMSPGGRFFAFQEPDLTVSVYDTTTRKSRPTGATRSNGASPDVLSLTWLPDESAFAILFSSGNVTIISPQTEKAESVVAGGGSSSGYLVLDPSTGTPLVRKNWRCSASVTASPLPVTLPADASRTVRVPSARRTMSFGKGAWALWDEATGKVLRSLGGVLSFEPSPSGRFIAVVVDGCGKSLGCGGAVQVIDVVSAAIRWTLELPEVTTSSLVKWFGPASGEMLAVLEKNAQFLRPLDGVILHAEPPSSAADSSPVFWTENGLVDAADVELKAWAFRPAGRLDHVVDATRLHHPNLWNAFRDGRPLPVPSALNEGTRGP